jgi:thiamine pyrophosphate-dependent acetolactate synthase large subunit-like protein
MTAEPNESLDALLHRAFGFAAFRPNQEEVCRTVIEGRDALLVMPTGAGKSLCYQLPGLARGGTTLVISPLIALMEDQFQKLRDRGFAVERILSVDLALASGSYSKPQRIAFFRELDREAAQDAVMVADGGDFVATASYIVHPRTPLSWLDPGVFGTLGVGAGFALGAALCRPQSEVWIIYGDGACGYSLIEFDTFVRHGIPVIAVVGNDAGWTQIAREQVKMLHDDVGTVLARTAYHEVAAGFGAEGILVTKAEEVIAALARARAMAKAGKPVLINVWLDQTDFREGSISM